MAPVECDYRLDLRYIHDLQHPEVHKVTRQAIAKIVAAGKVAGTTPCSTEQAIEHHKLGVRFFYMQPLALAAEGLATQIRTILSQSA